MSTGEKLHCKNIEQNFKLDQDLTEADVTVQTVTELVNEVGISHKSTFLILT